MRGLPKISIAFTATSSAWVESRPPETPMISSKVLQAFAGEIDKLYVDDRENKD